MTWRAIIAAAILHSSDRPSFGAGHRLYLLAPMMIRAAVTVYHTNLQSFSRQGHQTACPSKQIHFVNTLELVIRLTKNCLVLKLQIPSTTWWATSYSYKRLTRFLNDVPSVYEARSSNAEAHLPHGFNRLHMPSQCRRDAKRLEDTTLAKIDGGVPGIGKVSSSSARS